MILTPVMRALLPHGHSRRCPSPVATDRAQRTTHYTPRLVAHAPHTAPIPHPTLYIELTLHAPRNDGTRTAPCMRSPIVHAATARSAAPRLRRMLVVTMTWTTLLAVYTKGMRIAVTYSCVADSWHLITLHWRSTAATTANAAPSHATVRHMITTNATRQRRKCESRRRTMTMRR